MGIMVRACLWRTWMKGPLGDHNLSSTNLVLPSYFEIIY
jgi:hypothetical protein